MFLGAPSEAYYTEQRVYALCAGNAGDLSATSLQQFLAVTAHRVPLVAALVAIA